MIYLLVFLIFVVLFLMVSSYLKKKKLAKFKQELIDNWGKPKIAKYYNFNFIDKYFKNNEHKKQAYHLISDREEVDLDMEELFMFIDRTSSRIGQQFLYYKLRTIYGIDKLLKFDALTQAFDKNPTLRLECQLQLSTLNSRESYYLEAIINGTPIDKPKNIWLVYLLSLGSLLAIIAGSINSIFFLTLLPIVLTNSFIHYKNKQNLDYYLNGVVQLIKSLKVSKSMSGYAEIKEHFNDFSFIKRIQAISSKIAFVGFEKNFTNDFEALFMALFELFKMLFNLEYLIFYSLLDSISKEKKSIDSMFCFIGEIDAAISTASLKAGDLQMCAPVFISKKEVFVEELSHPLIQNCVPNDLYLADESLLLSGSNMSGKTTFIRALALNSILAQTLHVCFAKKYSAPYFRLYTSIRITDDLLDNTSYYFEEVMTIKNLIDASEKEEPCLFVLDEIFKGANTVERISGGKAILSYLNKGNHVVVVSTHDIELTTLLEKEKYMLSHFTEHVTNNELIFDHKLKSGSLTTRNAIKILELNGYPTEVISEAGEVEKNCF